MRLSLRYKKIKSAERKLIFGLWLKFLPNNIFHSYHWEVTKISTYFRQILKVFLSPISPISSRNSETNKINIIISMQTEQSL